MHRLWYGHEMGTVMLSMAAREIGGKQTADGLLYSDTIFGAVVYLHLRMSTCI